MVSNFIPPRTSKVAEGSFKHLCDKGGVVANPVSDDQHGWDFIVEFPPQTSNRSPDVQPPNLKCLVQIKSRTRSGRSCSLKLSNALQFAKSPLPCFVVLFCFEGDPSEPSAIYVRHFGKEEIQAALRAARQAHADGKLPLNRKSFRVGFAEGEKIEAKDLVQRMASDVLGAGPDYSESKLTYGREVGFEDGYGIGNFKVQLDGPGGLVDMMLGIAEDVPVTDFVIREHRFGIADPIPTFEAQSGRLSFEPNPVQQGQVVLRAADGEQFTLQGEVFAPSIPDLPEESLKIRIKTALLEVVLPFGGAAATVTARFDPEKELSFGEALDLAGVWSCLAQASVGLEVWVNGFRLACGTVNLDDLEGTSRTWKFLHRSLKGLVDLVPTSRWPTEAKFSLKTLWESRRTLAEFVHSVAAEASALELTGGTSPNADKVTRSEVFARAHYLHFGSCVLFVIVKRDIRGSEIDGDIIRLELSEPVYLQRMVLKGGYRENFEFMDRETKDALKRHGIKGVLLGALVSPEEDLEDN